ncbi:MAG: hypothetical protein AAB649_07250 [Patescibacteria group bacterium]
MIEAKRRLLELYTSGELERDDYINKNLEYDNETNRLKIEKVELIKRIPLLHKKEVIDTSIQQYCEGARIRFEKCTDFETKRQFLLDYVDKVVYWNEKVELHGFVPIKLKVYEGKEETTQLAKIEFCIKDTIHRMERFGRHDRQPDHSMRIKRKEYELFQHEWSR